MPDQSGSQRAKESTRRRAFRAASTLLFALFALASLELIALQYLKWHLNRNPRVFEYTVEQHMRLVEQSRIDGWISGKRAYRADPDLGWRRSEGRQSVSPLGWTLTTDEMGARVIPGQQGDVWLSTYGDSFTECVEVNDEETWQAHLVDMRGGRVLNFGVAGFGPDQALLYLERNLERGLHTPVVVLAAIEEDMDRNLNAFRPFYTWPQVDLVLGFKPRFMPDDDGGFVLRFAAPDTWEPAAIRLAMNRAAGLDYYHARRVERIAFPYTASAIGLIARQGLIPEAGLPRETAIARDTMAYVLERFATLARLHDFVPVVVLLPSSGSQIRNWGAGYRDALTPVVERSPGGLTYINVVDHLGGPDGREYLGGLDLDDYIRGNHASPAGNAAVARVLDAALPGPAAGQPGRHGLPNPATLLTFPRSSD